MPSDTELFLCFGPPGCGKTSYLRDQSRSWALDVGNEAVVAVSFTRAAAAELRARGLALPPRNIGTLHSFAYRALDDEDVELAEEHVNEFTAEHPGLGLSFVNVDLEDGYAVEEGARTDADLARADYELRRQRMEPRETWPAKTATFADAWEAWKRDNGYVDFTDLIVLARANTTRMPTDPAVALFDEAQDFTPLEFDLVRHWGKPMERVVLAGDDDQVLYAFKGASPDPLLDPDIDGAHRKVLPRTFRCSAAVHALANRWIGQVAQRQPKTWTPTDDEGSIGRRADVDYNRRVDALLPLIEADLAAGSSVMVLATCGYMLQPLVDRLRAEGVPFHNPYRVTNGAWNPLRLSKRSTPARILSYLRTQPDVWGEDARWYHGRDLTDWLDVISAKGLLARGAKSLNLDPSTVVELDLFDSLWVPEQLEAAVYATQTGDLAWLEAHLLAAKRKAFAYPLRIAKRRGGAVLRETPRLIVGTIHSVKGGEADVVYCFPDVGHASYAALRTQGNRPHHDAVVRQFYVAITRARHRFVVCDNATPFTLSPRYLAEGKIR